MQPRSTRQKEIINKVIEGAERPLTIQEVLAKGQKHFPGLSIATVYREINRLMETKEIHPVTIPGDPPRYERNKPHHHHFKCTECNKVYELEGCLKEINKLIPKVSGSRAMI